jgi:hypothetical protein
MLIDLQWNLNHARKRVKTEYCTEFNTDGGHLIVTFEFPPDKKDEERIFRRCIARRIHCGVYSGWNLYNELADYTEWKVEHPWTRSQELFTAMGAARERGDDNEWERMRELFFQECTRNSYGVADNLKQIFKYGGKFIRSPHPHILAVHRVDYEGCELDRYLEKNRPYIGTQKRVDDMKNLIHFEFMKLVKKNECGNSTEHNELSLCSVAGSHEVAS